MNLPKRTKLYHDVPAWVEQGSVFFVSVNCKPRGVNTLCKKPVASQIIESIAHRHRSGEWWVRLFLLMPDHCHALISFSHEKEMAKSIANWKRFVARQSGIQWQRDFFDHRIREGENLDEKAHYIRMNPVRKGLCKEPGDWSYVWSFLDFEKH